MKQLIFAAVVLVAFSFSSIAVESSKTPVSVKSEKAAPTKVETKSAKADTIVVKARLVAIPGPFPPNDLYNYVYVMKYRVLGVVKGTLESEEILVGHYNPLIPRKLVKDKMDKLVDGDVERFEEGAKQVLTLVKPIDSVWKDAKEDEYFDVDDSEKFYCVKAETLK